MLDALSSVLELLFGLASGISRPQPTQASTLILEQTKSIDGMRAQQSLLLNVCRYASPGHNKHPARCNQIIGELINRPNKILTLKTNASKRLVRKALGIMAINNAIIPIGLKTSSNCERNRVPRSKSMSKIGKLVR